FTWHVTEPASGPVVSILATGPIADEFGPVDGEFRISRTGTTTAALTVQFTVDGTATEGDDYATLPRSVVIPAGSSSVSLPVTVLDDNLVEWFETVAVTLSPGPDYQVDLGHETAVVLIDDDEHPQDTPKLSVAVRPTVEGDPWDQNTATFTLSVSGTITQPVTVHYQTVPGTATEGDDYLAREGDLTFTSSQPTVTVTVPLVGDLLSEADENFTLA